MCVSGAVCLCVFILVYTVCHCSVTLWSSALKICLCVLSGPICLFLDTAALSCAVLCVEFEEKQINPFVGDLEVLKLQCFNDF